MELEEAKQLIVRTIAYHYGKMEHSFLELTVKEKIGSELYTAALESLEKEVSISDRTDIHGGKYSFNWELTKFGIKKYNLDVRRYVPEPRDTGPSGMLKVVGTGGQELGWTSAPSRIECIAQCCGFLIFLGIIILLAIGL